MAKPLRTAAMATVAVGMVLGITWLGSEHLGPSNGTGPAIGKEQDPKLPAEPTPLDAGAIEPRARVFRVPIAAPAGADGLAFKAYRVDLCLFAAARVRAIAASAGGETPSAAGKQRALHACEIAASQAEPPARALDAALVSFVQLLKDTATPAALDEQWRRLAGEIESWRVRNPALPRGGPESERLARAAFEKARSIISRIAWESQAGWASASWLQSERARFKESIVALARYGTQHSPDAWITIVEPALEAVLRELQAAPTGTDHGSANLMRVFLMLIEANQRAIASK